MLAPEEYYHVVHSLWTVQSQLCGTATNQDERLSLYPWVKDRSHSDMKTWITQTGSLPYPSALSWTRGTSPCAPPKPQILLVKQASCRWALTLTPFLTEWSLSLLQTEWQMYVCHKQWLIQRQLGQGQCRKGIHLTSSDLGDTGA